MHRDPLEELAQLRDRADSVAQKMAAAQAKAAAYAGSDGSGTITVRLEESGRVREVAVDRSWREQVGIDGLAAAVQEAAQAAALARLEVWGDAFVEQDNTPDPRARPMPLSHDTLASQLDELSTAKMTSGQGQAALEELLAMAEAIERGIDQVSGQIQAVIDATYTGHSRGGHATVTVSGAGAVSEVRYERRWLINAHEINIGRATTEAFRDAYEKAGTRTVADLIAQSPLGEVQALSQDPLGLARRLHLRDS